MRRTPEITSSHSILKEPSRAVLPAAGDQETYAVIGAAMEVHRRLGHGFLEAVYQEALAVELTFRSIPFQREAPIVVVYRDQPLDCKYRADFLCYADLIVELKGLTAIGGLEQGQLLNYLRATGYRRGLLVNFGNTRLEYKRMVV